LFRKEKLTLFIVNQSSSDSGQLGNFKIQKSVSTALIHLVFFCQNDKKMQLTNEQRAFVVKRYFETKSFVAVKESFQQRFPGRNSPSKSTIQRNVENYTREGTNHNLNKRRSGRLRTARNQENVNAVRALLERHAW